MDTCSAKIDGRALKSMKMDITLGERRERCLSIHLCEHRLFPVNVLRSPPCTNKIKHELKHNSTNERWHKRMKNNSNNVASDLQITQASVSCLQACNYSSFGFQKKSLSRLGQMRHVTVMTEIESSSVLLQADGVIVCLSVFLVWLH